MTPLTPLSATIELPVLRLLERSPSPAPAWVDAAVAAGVGVALTACLTLAVAALIRRRESARHPHEAAVARLSRAHRLTPEERRLLELASQRSRVDRLAMLVAPSAFDRAAAMAELPPDAARALRARLFGAARRAA